MSSSKGRKKHSFVDSFDPFEQGREVVRSLGHRAGQEANQSAKTALAQMFGVDNNKTDAASETHAVTTQNPEHQQANGVIEIFNLLTHRNTTPSEKQPVHADKAPRTKAEAAIDYHGQFRNEIVKSREKASSSEMHEMRQNIQQIKAELSKLVASSEMLKFEFAEVSVEQSMPSVGQYHLNFFEWMLAVIRSARQKVEDSGAWLNTAKGKGAQKSYWGMFKKHGTTFGLSGERAVATQVG